MIHKIYNITITVLIIICAFVLASLLNGCSAKYEVSRCEGVGTDQVCSYAKISTRREFENGLEIIYNGENRTFEFRANKVGTNVSPLEVAAASIIEAVALGAIPLPTKQIPQE